MKSIQVTLPADRWSLGRLEAFDDSNLDKSVFGPVSVDGKSDTQAAEAHGNPTNDPARPYGNTPWGDFTATIGHVEDDQQGINRHSYGMPDATGKIPVIWLTPIQGDGTSEAWQRQEFENAAAGHAVDMGLAIHSGPPNGSNQLRPTHGCLRMWQKDFKALLALFAGVLTFDVLIKGPITT